MLSKPREYPNSHSHKYRDAFNITMASWNTRSLAKEGALPEMCQNLDMRQIDICLLPEHHLPRDFGKEFSTMTHHFKECYGKLAWAISKDFSYEIQTVALTERISILKIPDLKAVLIGIYAVADTEFHTKDERTLFYNQIADLTEQFVEEAQNVVLLGDWNVQLPPPLLTLWEHAVHDENRKLNAVTMTRDNKEVAEGALTTVARLHLEVTTYKKRVSPDFHTAEIKAFGTKSVIDYMAMSEDLATHVEFTRALWPSELKFFNPDHALVYTKTAIYDTPPQRRAPQGPIFSPLDNTNELDTMADELTKKATAIQKHAKEGVILETSKRHMETKRKFIHEETALTLEEHVPPEMRTHERMKESRRQDEEDFQVELAAEMLACIEAGDTAGVFAIARGKKQRTSEKAISAKQKKIMEDAYKNLVGRPHDSKPDESKWDIPDYMHGPEVEDSQHEEREQNLQWETYFVDGSHYASGKYEGSMGFAFHQEGSEYMTCGPSPTTDDGTPCSYTPEVWSIVEVMERSTTNVHVKGDCQAAGNIIDNIEFHAKNDFESISHAKWWRRVYFLKRGRSLTYEFVQSHNGDILNEVVDKGAKYAARHLRETVVMKLPTAGEIPGEPHIWARVTNENTQLKKIEEDFLLDNQMHLFCRESAPTTPPPSDRQPKYKKAALTSITKEKVIQAMKRIRNVAPGEDGVFARTYDHLVDDLTLLFQACWRNKRVPTQFKRAILCAIPKKDGPISADNFRGITLINSASKILSRIILDAVDNPDHSEVPQYGFTKGCSTTDAIHIARSTIHALRTQRKRSLAIFLDIEKAYDNLNREALETILKLHGFCDTAIAIIQDLWDDEIVMKFQDSTHGHVFKSARGVHQGDVLSPLIFILCLNTVLKDVLRKHNGVVFVKTKGTWQTWEPGDDHVRIKALLYADDIMVVCENCDDAQELIDNMNDALDNIGLRVSPSKSKVMFINKDYVDEHDSVEGYASRAVKTLCSSVQRPFAEYIAVTGPRQAAILHMPDHASDMRCPHPECPYVAREELSDPWRSMEEHMQQRHEILCNSHQTYERVPEELVQEALSRNWTIREAMKVAPIVVKGKNGKADEVMEVVDVFNYLGSILSNDDDLDPEIDARIAKATKAFYSFPFRFWRNSRIPTRTRVQVYESCILPLLTYAAETWVISEAQESRLTAVYMRGLRAILSLHTWSYDIQPMAPLTIRRFVVWTNEEVLLRAGTWALSDVLRQKRMRQLGTTIRRNPECFTAEAAQIVGEATHRGPRARSWLQVVAEDMAKLGIGPALGKNPPAWKKATQAKRWGHDFDES